MREQCVHRDGVLYNIYINICMFYIVVIMIHPTKYILGQYVHNANMASGRNDRGSPLMLVAESITINCHLICTGEKQGRLQQVWQPS